MAEEYSSADVRVRLRCLRRSLNMGYDEAASAIGVDRTTLEQLEVGNEPLTSTNLTKLARLYGVSLLGLLDGNYSELDGALERYFIGHQSKHPPELDIVRHNIEMLRELMNLQRLLGSDNTSPNKAMEIVLRSALPQLSEACYASEEISKSKYEGILRLCEKQITPSIAE